MEPAKNQPATVATIAFLLLLTAIGGGAAIQRSRSGSSGSSQAGTSPTVAASPAAGQNQQNGGAGGAGGAGGGGGADGAGGTGANGKSNTSGFNTTQQQGSIDKFISPTPKPLPPVTTLVDCGYGEGQPACVASNPKTCAIWNESKCLSAFQKPGADGILHMWYDDEKAMTLGAGTITTTTQSPDHAVNPNTGDQSTAGMDSAGRPVRPALFITDITTNATSRSGDWENGGTAYNPSEIFGTWKALGNPDDGTPNGSDLGTGSMPAPVPPQYNYSTEVRWNLNDPAFGLIKGHSYRLEFMVHDGDVHDNGMGADSGEKCADMTF